MPFSLMNAPSSFQEMMDDILRDLDTYTVWYIDDILIHTKAEAEAEHKAAVAKVLQRLMDHDLAVNLRKSEFHLQEVQAFLGFANYYRRFIQDYARRAKPLTHLTKGGSSKGTKGEPSKSKC